MRTPYGVECSYYYEDFNRGRNIQECRLAERSGTKGDWTPKLCKDCPAPSIQRANSCEHMALEGRVEKGFLGLTRKIQVTCWCNKLACEVAEPEIGCGECHADNPLLAKLFEDGLE